MKDMCRNIQNRTICRCGVVLHVDADIRFDPCKPKGARPKECAAVEHDPTEQLSYKDKTSRRCKCLKPPKQKVIKIHASSRMLELIEPSPQS